LLLGDERGIKITTSVSDKEFELPKGYKKLENPMAF